MESEISFLPKPKINPKNLKYITNTKSIYANLYQIILSKDLLVYQYPFSVTPEIEAGDSRMRQALFKGCSRQLKSIYGECLISGDSLYGLKKVEELKSVKSNLELKGKVDSYVLDFSKFVKEKTIKQQDVLRDELTKQFIELLIKDILHANPKLEFYKDLFVYKKKKTIESGNVSVNFYPGFTTSFMETDNGNFLNVTLKNKIIQSDSILDVLKDKEYDVKQNQKDIREDLQDKSFKVSYGNENKYKIDDILFDRDPKKQTINYNGKSINLIEYYNKKYKIKIKDEKQPLIVVHSKTKNGEPQNNYFVPELCFLENLEDSAKKDGNFMKLLAQYTKLDPSDRVKKTNEFIKLLEDPSKDPKHPEKLSAKEKSNIYGIKVKPVDELFTGYIMSETKLLGGNNKPINPSKPFDVLQKKSMLNWVCFYEKSNYNDAENLFNTLTKASKGYKLKIEEPEWVEMPNKSSARDWTDTADDYVGNGKKDYSFVVFLIGRNDYIYSDLKKHSLCKNGYVSQVVKAKNIQGKRAMSVCSKILLQINAKLGGISYKADVDKEIKNRKIMVIGVDSSHTRKRTGVAMVASINESFTDFYNKEQIIKEENKAQLQFCVSSFIAEAVSEYNKKNKEIPKSIIIYRQGVSLHQKLQLKEEILQIEEMCKTKNILFYYILVNTKTTYKFFEVDESEEEFYNPESGLLVLDGVTNRNYFEFYIQPQQVTGGSATPTCFHVAYGNMDFPEMIPKFTFDLCHIYSNWQGTVRIPNVIKAAEKLSKMTAKYKLDELNTDLKIGQAYL
jgi:aubergine-like protein